jgi:hypothetical protein
MQRISRDEYEDLTRGATPLSTDEHGPKVLLRPDGLVIKLFRRKRLRSSALWRPYARRFESASRELARRGIVAARVEHCGRVPCIQRDLVVYRRLEGTPLRDALALPHADLKPLLGALATTLAQLHERAVYFRAAHFGNLLVQPDYAPGHPPLALIDLSEARFRSRPLSPAQRARNFRPFTRHAQDLACVQAFGVRRFIDNYLEACQLNGGDRNRFLAALRSVHPAFAKM